MEQVFTDLLAEIRNMTVSGRLKWSATADENTFVATVRIQGKAAQLEISRHEEPVATPFGLAWPMMPTTTTSYVLVMRRTRPETSTVFSTPDVPLAEMKELFQLAGKRQRADAARELLDLLRTGQAQADNPKA